MVLLLIASGDSPLPFFTDERVQERVASLRAFSESHPLPQLDFGHVSKYSALPIAHRALRTADGVEPPPLASTSHPTVSIPLPWAELEDGTLHQTSLTPQVLIGRLGDRFAAALQANQRLC